MLNRVSHFILPIGLLILEIFFQKPHPGGVAFFSVAMGQQPLPSLLVSAQICGRLLAGYVCVYSLFCLFLRRFPIQYRKGMFLIAYAGTILFVGVQKPAYISWGPFLLAILSLIIGFRVIRTAGLRSTESAVGDRFFGATLFLSLAFLWVTIPKSWELSAVREIAVASKKQERPNFFWMGWDGVPGEIFEFPLAQEVVPAWTRSLAQGSIHFSNAYAVSNSTYTSWYSMLTGKYSKNSGVELLFPPDRNPDKNLLLPKLLAGLGYETVYMTDCASTAFMDSDLGFDRIYQRDRGVFECSRSLLTSLHPLLYLFGFVDRTNLLFPELDTFCSALYRPENFYRKVQAELLRLEKLPRPYFLAVHSCLTHQDVFRHVPSLGRSRFFSEQARAQYPEKFLQTISETDRLWSELVAFQRHYSPNTWHVLLADHGIVKEKGHLSHAFGAPLGRSQYHVPLTLWPPAGSRVTSSVREELVGLVDLFSTVQAILGRPGEQGDGFSLLEKGAPHRGLWLNSSFPSELAVEALKRVQINDRGELKFPEEIAATLIAQNARAHLVWPTRTLFYPDGKRVFIDEKTDQVKTLGINQMLN